MIPTVVHMLKFSGTYKGQWIYRAAPIQNESSIYSGTLKACIINYFIPIYLVLSILFCMDFLVSNFSRFDRCTTCGNCNDACFLSTIK